MADVFINYRTGDGDEAAALIERELSERFTSEQIFRASKSISAGEFFNEALLGAVRNSRVLLAIIGPTWAHDPHLRNEDDWVRREIQEAFKYEKRVIPILKGRMTERLKAEDLPPQLARLADAQSLRLDIRNSAADLKRIGDELASLVPALRAADRLASSNQQPQSVSNSTGDVEGSSVQARDITGDVGYNVKENYGSVNTGTQHYYGYSDSLNVAKAISPRNHPAEYLRRLAQRFIEPGGMDDARKKLEKHHAVFIDAGPGSGRAASAQMLLWRLRPDAYYFQELVPQDENPYLNQEQIGDGDRVWVDLSSSIEIWPAVLDQLSSLMAVVEKRDAYLALILPDKDKRLPPGFSQYRAPISRPSSYEVISRYLEIENIPRSASQSLQKFLAENRPLREIARYAELIGEARHGGSKGGDFDSWCAVASHALSNRDRDVTELIAKLDKGPQRALLLTTAMLHESQADRIHSATQLLLKIVKQPHDEVPVLERDTFDRRLTEIGAERDVKGYVHFTELDYDEAIRRFFWTYIPEIRPSLQVWVERVTGLVGTEEEQEELIRRFCDQALAERYQPMLFGRYHPMLFGLVDRWTSNESAYRRARLAKVILEQGLRDEQSGRAFRKKIYDWSSTSNLPERLADVIIAVCRDEMAVSHPAQAVVRLHHLARHERRSLARDTLVALAIGDPRFLRQVLIRLTDPPGGINWPIDVEIFLRITDPEMLTNLGPRDRALIADDDVRRQLTDGWNLVFSEQKGESWQFQAKKWLLHAATYKRNRDRILDVLVEAGTRHQGIAARLYAMACERETIDQISDLVFDKINKTQGIDFF